MPTLIPMMLIAITAQAADPASSPVRPAIEPFGYRGVSLDDGPLSGRSTPCRGLPADPQ